MVMERAAACVIAGVVSLTERVATRAPARPIPADGASGPLWCAPLRRSPWRLRCSGLTLPGAHFRVAARCGGGAHLFWRT
jgi:hypothetical protein